MAENNIMKNIWFIVLSFGMMQGVFLSIALFFKKDSNRNANRFLAFLLLLFSFLLGGSYFYSAGLYQYIPHLIGVFRPFWFLLPIMFYFYISFLLNKPEKRLWVIAVHLIPFIIIVLDKLPFYLASSEIKLSGQGGNLFLFKYNGQKVLSFFVLRFFAYTNIISYLIATTIKIRNYEQNFKKISSQVSFVIYLQWVRKIFIAFVIYVIIELIVTSYLFYTKSFDPQIKFVTISIISVFTHYVAYYAIFHSDTIFPAITNSQVLKKETKNVNQYDNKIENIISSESNNIKIEIEDKSFNNKQSLLSNKKVIIEKQNKDLLINIMTRENLHRNCDLKLIDLCGHLSLTTHQVSNLLNNQLKTNFYDFINSYRIKEVKQLLLDKEYQNLTILGIALDVGFKNSSSFYRIFKKEVGLTPKDYISSNQK